MRNTKCWYIVVERTDYDCNPLPNYYFGPMTKGQARKELDSDTGLTFDLLTTNAKHEGYVAGYDVYMTKTPEGLQIHQPEIVYI